MNDQDKTKEELIQELQELRQENNSIKVSYEKDITEYKQARKENLRHLVELTTLLRISQEFATTLDLAKILQITTDRVTELTELKSSAIYLLEGETLRLWATNPPLPPQFPDELREALLAEHPHICEAITTGLPVFLFDSAAADLTPAERAICELRSLRSLLYLPLLVGTQVLGVLIVTTSEEPQRLSEAEVNLFSTFANLAAMGVGNAHLYKSQKRYARELENRVVERKQAEEALKQSEYFFKESQRAATIGSYKTDVIKGRWESSEVLDQIFGIDSEYDRSVSGWLDIVHPDDKKMINTYLMEEVLQKNKSFNKEYRIVRIKDKEIRWVLGLGTVNFNDKDQVVSLIGTIQDITERKQGEEKLRKLNKAIETAAEVVFMTDKEGIFTYVNPAFTAVYGYESDDVVGKTTPRIIKSGHLDTSVYQYFWQALIENQVVSGELINKTKDGREIYIWSSSSAILNDSGEVTGYLAIQNDITSRKQVEIELQAVREVSDAYSANLTAIIEGTTASIWAFNRNFEIIYVNQVFQKEFQQTFGVLLEPGVSLIEALPNSLRPFWKPRYDRVLANEQFTVEDAIDTDNGTIYLQVMFNPIVKNGQVIGGSCFGSDITSRKLEEIELVKAKDRAEESDRLKSAFLSNMSHEIRTPMNGILGFAGLLKEPNLSGEEQQNFIQNIEKAGARMLNIINQIVDISRIEAGIMKVSLSETNIIAQLEYVYYFLKPEAEQKRLKFLFQTSLTEKEAVIQTDQEKIYTILTNLVKNAIKYTDKGSIEIGCDIVKTDDRINLETQGIASLQFYVKDTGIGIPKDRQKAIFERFIQADIVDKMARQGAGLGLTISKAYVEMLGGKIWVESEEENLQAGKAGNTTFYFTLPYKGESLENLNDDYIEQSKNQIKPKVSKLKIVIAEDDVSSGMLLSITLNPFASEIFTTTTGTETVEVCRNNSDIDLVLMDILMPGMNGFEATRQIRQFNRKVIIIAQTAFALAGDREKSLEAGCNDYISKPINKVDLLALVQKYFQK